MPESDESGESGESENITVAQLAKQAVWSRWRG
jgi:hypothetical protein